MDPPGGDTQDHVDIENGPKPTVIQDMEMTEQPMVHLGTQTAMKLGGDQTIILNDTIPENTPLKQKSAITAE